MWGAVAPSTYGASVSATLCACTTEAAAGTLTPSVPKRVSAEAEMCYMFTSAIKSVDFAAFLHASQLSVPVSRGDTFSEVEDVSEAATTPQAETTVAATLSALAATTPTPTTPLAQSSPGPSLSSVDTDAAPCSGRPFDAFLQLKNTSIYAFRGKH